MANYTNASQGKNKKKAAGPSVITNDDSRAINAAHQSASKLDSRMLPAYERAYYQLPEFMRAQYGDKTADQRSQMKSSTRGAQYAQQNRINQIRAKSGVQEAFDPITDIPSTPDANAQAMLGYQLALANGASIKDASKLVPGKMPANYRNSSGYLGDALQAAGARTQEDIDAEIKNLEPYLRNRYQADAVKAGTLTDSEQSQSALKTDVQAGLGGARTALEKNKELLNSAMSPTYSSNPTLFPVGTSATAGNAPAPSAPPNQQDTDANVVSGQVSKLTPQKRLSVQSVRKGR